MAALDGLGILVVEDEPLLSRQLVAHLERLGADVVAGGPQLEFLDGSGTLFYLETVISTNALPEEFYRATLVLP